MMVMLTGREYALLRIVMVVVVVILMRMEWWGKIRYPELRPEIAIIKSLVLFIVTLLIVAQRLSLNCIGLW